MIDPRQLAYDTVDRMIAKGLSQGHPPDLWRDEPLLMHVIKAMGHLVTALRIIEGYSEPDGENHLENALCRVDMALSCKESQNG